MHADRKQHGREQARIVDAHRVHPAMAELDGADLSGPSLLRRTHGIAGDATAHVLEADLTWHQGLPPLGAAREDELPEHLVLDQRQKVVVALVLVMMPVHVDNQKVVEIALHGLLAGVREQPAGIELFERDGAAAIGKEVHGRFPLSCVSNQPLYGLPPPAMSRKPAALVGGIGDDLTLYCPVAKLLSAISIQRRSYDEPANPPC